MKISVITVCYNAVGTIEDTLSSLRRQNYPNIEHIVVDGGSTDGTVDMIRKHEARIDRWISGPDNGLYDAMNKGLQLATGDYVGFLNADDVLAKPTAIETIATHAELTNASMVFGNLVMIDDSNPGMVVRFYDSSRFKPWHMRLGDMPPHPTTYVRREMLSRVGGFRTDLSIAGDFDLLSRLIIKKGCSFTHIPETLVAMRLGGVSTGGFSSTLRINREIAHSLRANNIGSFSPLLWLRYVAKCRQFLHQPRDLDANWRAPFGSKPAPPPSIP